MSEYWSGSITFTGLGSSMDFDSIIEAQLKAESYRKTSMETAQTSWTSKLTAVQDLNTQLSDFYTTLADYASTNAFLARTCTSSDTGSVAVTAGEDAEEATHTVQVNQLARNDVWTSTADYASASTAVTDTAQVFSYTYGSRTYSVDVPAGTTLQGLATLINNASGTSTGVRASIIDDGTASHLQLRGMQLGKANAITLVDTGFTALGPDTFSNTQAARNAQIKVDGYPSDDDSWIERATNTIDDVISGVSLQLYAATGSDEVTITTASDADGMKTAIETIVGKINEIYASFMALEESDTNNSTTTDSATTADDTSTSSSSVLTANYGVDMVENTIKSLLSAAAPGFSYYNATTGKGDLYTTLSSVGITTDADKNSSTFGQFIIDDDTLDAAIADNPEAVARLFGASHEGSTDSAHFSYTSSIKNITQPGSYAVSYVVQGGKLVSASINGNAASIIANNFTGMSSKPESGLSLAVDNLEDGTYTGTVNVKQGKMLELQQTLKRVTNASTGTLSIIETNAQSIIDNLQDSIDSETDRLSRMETSLKRKYSSLSTVLSNYDQLQSTLESLLSQLSTS